MQVLHTSYQDFTQQELSFTEQLQAYVEAGYDSWHTPGHAGGEGYHQSEVLKPFYKFLQENLFKADLSVSVDELDSLLEPKSVIKEAQAKAAMTFGAKRTFFVTNGSSTSNKIILQALVRPGEKVLLDRNSHMSAHQGAFLAGALPIYMDSSCNSKYGLFGPIPKQTIHNMIEQHPDAKVLFLTSCTYDGLSYDLRPIILHAHQYGIKVVIDEAWFAHGRFHQDLAPTALDCGADYVTQSIHKVLNAFSQASMIHVNDPGFDERIFREAYSLHTSSSPNYLIIASLDMARQQMELEGDKVVRRMMAIAKFLRNEINLIPPLKTLELKDLVGPEMLNEGIRLDPTKITIDISRLPVTTDVLLDELMQKHRIQIEKSTSTTITILVTAGTTFEKAGRFIEALMLLVKTRAGKVVSNGEQRLPTEFLAVPPLPAFGKLPREAQFAAGEILPILTAEGEINIELVGRIARDMVIPKPPGIPILIPGNLITVEVLEHLRGFFYINLNLSSSPLSV